MSTVDEMKEKFDDLEPKQKGMLVATIFLFLFVIYFGYQTFFASNGTSSAPTQPILPPQPMPVATTPTTASNTSMSSTGQTQSIQSASSQEQGSSITQVQPRTLTDTQKALLQKTEEAQKEYLKLVNQYQLAQLEQKLASTNAQIAAAKLQSLQTMLETQKISGQLNVQKGDVSPGSGVAQAPVKQSDPIANLNVVFVGKQGGRWTAMLNANGSYYEVKVGTRLPDGTVVNNISQNGVMILANGTREFLRIPKTLD